MRRASRGRPEALGGRYTVLFRDRLILTSELCTSWDMGSKTNAVDSGCLVGSTAFFLNFAEGSKNEL